MATSYRVLNKPARILQICSFKKFYTTEKVSKVITSFKQSPEEPYRILNYFSKILNKHWKIFKNLDETQNVMIQSWQNFIFNVNKEQSAEQIV